MAMLGEKVRVVSVIGHGIGGKYIPIMARLAKARRWSKRWQTCLSSPDLTAIHNEWCLEDPSTFTPRTTERSYDILRRVSYESQRWILDAHTWQVSWRGSPTRSKRATHVSRLLYKAWPLYFDVPRCQDSRYHSPRMHVETRDAHSRSHGSLFLKNSLK